MPHLTKNDVKYKTERQVDGGDKGNRGMTRGRGEKMAQAPMLITGDYVVNILITLQIKTATFGYNQSHFRNNGGLP